MRSPVIASIAEATVSVTVSSAAGGAGAAVANTTKTIHVILRNNGDTDFEYRVDAGSWVSLRNRSDVRLEIDLSVNTLSTRKAANQGNGVAVLELFSFDGTFAIPEADPIDVNQSRINEQTGVAYTLALTDAGGQVDMNNAAPNTLTIPTNATVPFPIGTVVWACMKGAGVTTIAAAGGVTILKPAAKAFAISAQYELARLHKVGTNTWRVNAT